MRTPLIKSLLFTAMILSLPLCASTADQVDAQKPSAPYGEQAHPRIPGVKTYVIKPVPACHAATDDCAQAWHDFIKHFEVFVGYCLQGIVSPETCERYMSEVESGIKSAVLRQ